jgi:Asp-tRNA(Asn)/Glu-tRNA(Gln) amidotransferase C subunit
MKRSLLVLAYLCLLCTTTFAQNSFPAGSEKLFNDVMKSINSRHSNWVKAKARDVNEKDLQEKDIRSMVTQYAVLGNISNADIEALCFLVLMQAAKSAQEDLKSIMAKVKAINNAKTEQRANLVKAQKAQENNSMTVTRYDSLRYLSARNIQLAKAQGSGTVKFRTSGNKTSITRSEIDALVDQMKNDLDSMSEMGEMESLRLQMSMDRMSKLMSTLSNILKKISKTAEEITQNLK